MVSGQRNVWGRLEMCSNEGREISAGLSQFPLREYGGVCTGFTGYVVFIIGTKGFELARLNRDSAGP